MLNKTGVAAIFFALVASGLGFAMYFVERWITDGELSINIERSCEWVPLFDIRACSEFDVTRKLNFNRYLQVAAGPGLSLMAALVMTIKLCCGVNCCSYLGAIKCMMSCGAYIASTIIFCHEHYWNGTERDKLTISWGVILTIVAAVMAMLAAILMIVSGCLTRNEFGGRVMDAMVTKRSTGRTPRNATTVRGYGKRV